MTFTLRMLDAVRGFRAEGQHAFIFGKDHCGPELGMNPRETKVGGEQVGCSLQQ